MLGAPCSPPSVPPPRLITTGCGFIVVSDSLLGFKSFVFDAVTKELVGASDGSDVGRGPCQATMYRAGNVPTEVCADATTCNFCTVSDTGAAGAADASSSYPQCEPP